MTSKLAVITPFVRGAAIELGNQLWKKRVLPVGDVQYEGRTLHFTPQYLSGLEQAFSQSDAPTGPYHFVLRELLSTLAGAGARLIMDGHGGDYTLHPRGQAALARFLATLRLYRFVSELRGHRRMTGASFWTTLKRDIAWPLLPTAVITLVLRFSNFRKLGRSR